MSAVRRGGLPAALVRDTWVRMGAAFGSETMQGLGIRKPYGYAGDFEMIDRIYQYMICENEHVRRWDEYFQSREACKAVRNRKNYFIQLLNQMVAQHGSLRVLNVGSGPARDVLEYNAGGNGHVKFDCVDMDPAAIAYAKDVCADVIENITFHNVNIFRYRSEQRYTLIWSAGLFDYLDDRTFIVLARRLIRMLAPGGRLVVGNFSTMNPTRDYMEFGEWFLHHRTPEQLLTLAKACEGDGIASHVDEEPLGVNLFLHIEKEV